LAEKIASHRKAQEPRSQETRYLSIPRYSIAAVVFARHDWSGRDRQWLADTGSVIDFIGRSIIMRLMNASAIVEIKIASQPGLQTLCRC